MAGQEAASPMTQVIEEFDLTTEHAKHFFGIDLEPINHFLAQLNLPIDISVNKAVVVLWLSALISFGLIYYAGKGRGLVATGLRNAVEAIFQFVKSDIVDDSMGHDGKKWLPFIGGLFFFILINNLLGLIPGSFAPTSNLNVTGALALVVFIAVIIQGMVAQGPFGYWKNLAPAGLPKALYLLMYPLEFVSLLAKPLSLAVRLFANLLAGHIVIFSLLALSIMAGSWLVKPVPVLAATLIYAFEIFVAFIQAYIFAILSALYLGSAMHPDH